MESQRGVNATTLDHAADRRGFASRWLPAPGSSRRRPLRPPLVSLQCACVHRGTGAGGGRWKVGELPEPGSPPRPAGATVPWEPAARAEPLRCRGGGGAPRTQRHATALGTAAQCTLNRVRTQTTVFLLKLSKKFAEPLRQGIPPAFQPQHFVQPKPGPCGVPAVHHSKRLDERSTALPSPHAARPRFALYRHAQASFSKLPQSLLLRSTPIALHAE